jgi:hypothetical protein
MESPEEGIVVGNETRVPGNEENEVIGSGWILMTGGE